MTYAICGVLSIITVIKGKKQHIELDYLILFVLFIIGGFSVLRPDYQVYYDFYKYHSLILGSISEPLYLVLNALFSNAGISYEVFFAAQVAVSLVLLYKTANYFEANISVVLILFAAYPFALNVVQIRNFLSFSIVLLGFIYLHKYYNNGAKKQLMLYIACITIASMIHYVAAFYLICIIPVVFKKLRTWTIILWGIFIGVLLSNIDILYSVFLPIIGERKANNWLSSGESFSLMHTLFILTLRIGLIILLYLINHTLRIKNTSLCNDGIEKSKEAFLNKEVLFLIITVLPLELFVQQYDRLTRVYLILFYILVSKKIPKIELNNRVIISLFTILIMGGLCYYEYSRGAASGAALWNTVFRSVFEHNALIGN